ncbi:MAG: hypothetical protein ACJATN_000052 [Neolewinella sp.]|jgi:hypothetical protein
MVRLIIKPRKPIARGNATALHPIAHYKFWTILR